MQTMYKIQQMNYAGMYVCTDSALQARKIATTGVKGGLLQKSCVTTS